MRLSLSIFPAVSNSWNKLLYRTHAWVGLVSGIFLILICVSGSVAVFKPELERALDWSGYDFNVKSEGRARISTEEAMGAAVGAYPGTQVTGVTLPATPGSIESHGETYAVRLTGNKAAGGNRMVLVHPYSAEVLPAKYQRGWGDWLRQLHVRMLYGSYWGRWVVGAFGLTLVFSTVSGLIIFTKFNRGSWKLSLRHGRGARIALGDWHKAVGLTTVAFNLMFGVTGAVLGLEGLYYRYWQPKDNSVPNLGAVAMLAPGVIDASVARSRELIPGSEPSSVDFLNRKFGVVRVRVEHGATSLVKEHESSVTFDAKTGEAVRVDDATKHSLAARAYYSVEPLHFGRLNGSMWVKLIWGLVGLSGGFLSISGFAIYVMRKRSKRRAAVPSAMVAGGAAVSGMA